MRVLNNIKWMTCTYCNICLLANLEAAKQRTGSLKHFGHSLDFLLCFIGNALTGGKNGFGEIESNIHNRKIQKVKKRKRKERKRKKRKRKAYFLFQVKILLLTERTQQGLLLLQHGVDAMRKHTQRHVLQASVETRVLDKCVAEFWV